MKKVIPTENKANNSNLHLSPKLLQTLLHFEDNGATVTYVFTESRISFEENSKGEYYHKKSNLVAPINYRSFFKEDGRKLKKKSITEIMEMFEQTRDDIGASYFIIS